MTTEEFFLSTVLGSLAAHWAFAALMLVILVALAWLSTSAALVRILARWVTWWEVLLYPGVIIGLWILAFDVPFAFLAGWVTTDTSAALIDRMIGVR